ncbi:MAG: phosphate ABC transporter permease PstA [Paracoccaceae bacterium]
MTDVNAHRSGSLLVASPLMAKRRAAEGRFRIYGIITIALSLGILVFMLWTIFADGISSFRQTSVTFPVMLDAERLDPSGNRNRAEMTEVTTIGYAKVIDTAFLALLEQQGIAIEGLSDKDARAVISKEAAGQLRDRVLADPVIVGTTIDMALWTNARIDGYFKGRVTMESAVRDGNVSPEQLQLAVALKNAGILSMPFNWKLLTGPDASDQRPEAAGLGISIIGSFFMMAIVAVLCVPIGVAASIYLEEFAPKNRWTDLIEVNVSNLAAVPSIVYGILGLAVFINFMGLPQSSSLVGGLVLTLMTLPTIIIATRASIRAVPPSIRDAALGVGASQMQTVMHHVLPLAMPGILTGAILGLARALGETAPLLLIGMVAFVDNYPSVSVSGVLDPATALPVQVYGWVQRGDPAFVERSSGAIIVLLLFLVVMNAAAILLRRRFERRW